MMTRMQLLLLTTISLCSLTSYADGKHCTGNVQINDYFNNAYSLRAPMNVRWNIDPTTPVDTNGNSTRVEYVAISGAGPRTYSSYSTTPGYISISAYDYDSGRYFYCYIPPQSSLYPYVKDLVWSGGNQDGSYLYVEQSTASNHSECSYVSVTQSSCYQQ